MTNAEFKKHLEENGGSVAEIEKITSTYDIEELEKIIDAASNPEEAFKNIKKQFPEFDADKAISQMNEIKRQLEIAAEAKPGAPGAIAGGIICGVIGAVAGAYYGWNCI